MFNGSPYMHIYHPIKIPQKREYTTSTVKNFTQSCIIFIKIFFVGKDSMSTDLSRRRIFYQRRTSTWFDRRMFVPEPVGPSSHRTRRRKTRQCARKKGNIFVFGEYIQEFLRTTPLASPQNRPLFSCTLN